jgi:hypothetical protein
MSYRTDYDSWPYRGHREQGEEDARRGRKDYDLYDPYDGENKRAYVEGYREEERRIERQREEREEEEQEERRLHNRMIEQQNEERQRLEEQEYWDQRRQDEIGQQEEDAHE